MNDALKAQIDKGTSFGAPCELENELAKMVIDRVPSVEMVRFCSSGTEACLSVLRLMRAFTKREKVLKFVGCYHGHADSFLVSAGSGVLTLGLPDSPGVPANVAAATLTATYNDLESGEGASRRRRRDAIAFTAAEGPACVRAGGPTATPTPRLPPLDLLGRSQHSASCNGTPKHHAALCHCS